MVYKFFPHLKDSEKGISLIEIIVVIVIIILLSMILISNFPEILRQYALSRVTYQLSQDMRSTLDLGLSGVTTNDGESPAKVVPIIGYGIYVSTNFPAAYPGTQYIIYANVKSVNGTGDSGSYNGDYSTFCNTITTTPIKDCIINIGDLRKQSPSLYIKSLSNISGSSTSINFTPPAPTITISNLSGNNSSVGIVLGLKNEASTRTVWINNYGLINVQ